MITALQPCMPTLRFTLPTTCLMARAFLCEQETLLVCSLKYPCGASSSELRLCLEAGMTIVVYCEDSTIFPVSFDLLSCFKVIDSRSLCEVQTNNVAYKLNSVIFPPLVTICTQERIPNLQILSRLSLGEQFVSEELSKHGAFPSCSRAVIFRYIQQADMSNIITIHPI